VDTHVAGVFDAMFAQLGELDRDGDAASFAELVTASLPPGSPIPAYLRRLLTDGGPVAEALFARWFAAGRTVLDALTRAGLARSVGDPDVAAAFLMVNDLALLLLRDQLTAVLGVDPLSPQGMARWVETVMAIYRGGIFAAPDAQTTAVTARVKRGRR
jgi:hypothetical protein